MIYDAILIGAGPIGLEQGQIGATITRWPRNTTFFSSPEWIAIAGIPIQTQGQDRVTGESYLAYLRQVVEVLDLQVNTYESVTEVTGSAGAFTVTTRRLDGSHAVYTGKTIVLATGDMNAADARRSRRGPSARHALLA